MTRFLFLGSLVSFVTLGLPCQADDKADASSALELQVGSCYAIADALAVMSPDDFEAVQRWRQAVEYWSVAEQRWALSSEQVAARRDELSSIFLDLEAKSPGMGLITANAWEQTVCCLPETLSHVEEGACPLAKAISRNLGGERG